MSKSNFNYEDFESLLLTLDRVKLKKYVNKLSKSHSLEFIINKLFSPALEHIGKLWEDGELALSQVYMAGHISEQLITELFPINKEKSKYNKKIGLAALEDFHPLGIYLVKSIMRSSGYNPILYKIGITVEELHNKVKKDNLDILILSTLMIRSVYKIKDLIEKLNRDNVKVKVIVGGAPFLFDNSLKDLIGADELGKNAFDVVRIIKNMSDSA